MKAFTSAATVVFIAAVMCVTAAASTPSQTTIQGAEATWYLDQDGVATAVLVRPVEERDNGPQATDRFTQGVDVQIAQDYIDPATGDEVFRLYVSEPFYAPASSITVDGLKGAHVEATVTLTTAGEDSRPLTVNVAATFTPTGGKTHTLSNLWDTEFGSWKRNRSNESTVPAIATASVTGDFNFGALGETSAVLATGHSFFMFRPPSFGAALTGMLAVESAESRSTYHIDGATSNWLVDDPNNTQVVLSVEQNHNSSGGAAAATTWVEIYGGYYDATTDEEVWFDLFSDVIAAPNASVDPNVQRASVSATYAVSGQEHRTPASGGGDETTTEVGPFQVTISAQWSATGQLTQYRKLFIEKTPDYSTKNHYYSKARQASAAGTIAGSFITAPLTDVQNAFLYDETETSTTR